MGRNWPDHVAGVDDPRTQRAIERPQQQHPLLANGDVTTETWHALQQSGCQHYTF